MTSLARHHTHNDTVFVGGHVGRLRIRSFWGCRNDGYVFSNMLGLELQVSSSHLHVWGQCPGHCPLFADILHQDDNDDTIPRGIVGGSTIRPLRVRLGILHVIAGVIAGGMTIWPLGGRTGNRDAFFSA